MKGFLLDTNHVGQVVRQNSPLWGRIYAAKQRGLRIGTCIPVLCEVESGRLNVARPDRYVRGLNALLGKDSAVAAEPAHRGILRRNRSGSSATRSFFVSG